MSHCGLLYSAQKDRCAVFLIETKGLSVFCASLRKITPKEHGNNEASNYFFLILKEGLI